jgi:protein-tyrosine-phosphatase
MNKKTQNDSKEILFVCVENAGRSQMAEAFADKYGLIARSAGTFPSTKINPLVVEAMKERGLDISSKVPKLLTSEMIERADLIVTMGCSIEAACPKPILARIMKRKLVDWELEDPKGKTLEEVRRIRDEIERRVTMLAQVQQQQEEEKSVRGGV